MSDEAPETAEYRASRARYIRTMASDAERRITESVEKRRGPLIDEIKNLTTLARDRQTTYNVALHAYAAKAPGRIKGGAIAPPLPQQHGADVRKLYKAAVEAAAAYDEITAILKKRKDRLAEIDWKLREQIEHYGRSLIEALETPNGLQNAFMRDPLLKAAHARMVAAEQRRAAVVDSYHPSDPIAADRLSRASR